MTDAASVAVLTGVHRSYDGRAVLTDVSFDVRRGEILALLGPNGAGKTTTVEIVEGYRRPERGDVRVLGVDPARAGRDHRARVGLMLQGGGGVDPRLTPREVLELHARFHADPQDPAELLRLVGLDGPAARTRYRRLSGGERQRAGLALALVGRPELAILDEPTAGMDVEARAATRDLLAALRADGVTILLTSHDLGDVERLADRIVILDRGRIVAVGAPDEIGGVPSGLRLRLAAALSAGDAQHLEERLGAIAEVRADGRAGSYRIAGIEPTPGLIAVLADWCAERGITILELRAGGGTLEERYLELTGGRAVDEP
ncbi:MAG TPA: ABC transporter ATP-binding protein [Candidatus Limnocylindrales bacterium]|nr:ABC transporter ATP-binding protein [Candidatus Limnocylindrales bacterium]